MRSQVGCHVSASISSKHLRAVPSLVSISTTASIVLDKCEQCLKSYEIQVVVCLIITRKKETALQDTLKRAVTADQG
ncbi:hypothetical protein H6P81_005026 [Aristolochia fimbriata]|uniref:Uncharacterized protein n=1 Tax=Aristolochia fimbriata TaxID=158543 RepID=A0AAV7ETF0_ARIFI|nr:hypothetical protein H6P81_005026 [Aristolochia fimbriata]